MTENKYIAIAGSAKTSEEAITLSANTLYKAGLVDCNFAHNCIIREREYPTGLPCEIPVAIPHCKDEKVVSNSICFLRLSQTVSFRRMDDEREELYTDMIFNIAIRDAEQHISFLRNLMRALANRQFLSMCRSLAIQEIPAYLEKIIEAADEN